MADGYWDEQPASVDANGYLALEVFDSPAKGGNGDGFITAADAIYSKLRVWIDTNHDGKSQENELHTLTELDISRIDLNFSKVEKTDQYGNLFRYKARIWDMAGRLNKSRFTYDVFLQ